MSNSVLNKLLKDFGDSAVMVASNPVIASLDVIPFPSFALGDAAHIWGWPKSRISQLHGPPGSGKTFFALLSILEAQKEEGTMQVWVDTEFQFSAKWATSLGIDVDRILLITNNDGSEVFSTLFGRVNDKGKKNKLGIVDYVKDGELNVNMIVLDSIANLIPPVEKGRNFDDQNIAALARFLPGAFNRAASDISNVPIAMICINQARVDMSSRVGGLTYPGGFKYKHILSLAVRLSASGAKDSTIFDSNGNKVGHKVLIKVEKTRFGPDKYSSDFMVNFYKGVVNRGEEVANVAAAYDVVQRPNNQTWVYGEHQVRGKDNFFALLEEQPALMDEIIAKVKEAKDSGILRPEKLNDESEEDNFDDSYGE